MIMMRSACTILGQSADEQPDCVGKAHFSEEANQQTAIIIINSRIASSSLQTNTTNYQSRWKHEKQEK